MTLKTRLLSLMPLWCQDLVVSIYGYKLIKQRYGKAYYRYRDEFLAQGNMSLAELEKIQLDKLNNFVRFARDNSLFYRKLYKDLPDSDFTSVTQLKDFPVVDKETLRVDIESAYTLKPSQGISSFTGGTTGKSLQVVFTKDDFQKRMAKLDAFKLSVGIDPFETKKATFSGREFTRGWATENKKIFWRNNWAYKQRLYSTFDLQEENLQYYLDDLNEYQPEVINGFVSAIYDIAQFIEKENIQLTFEVKGIFTTSETLLPHHRELIERVFKTKVYNQYASAEGAPFITQCPAGNLHFQLDTGVIETLESSSGDEMLVTAFETHGTPLIRYRIGDGIIWQSGKCRCGSNHPMVAEIKGRKVEYLLSPDYGKVSASHLADVIKGLPNCVRNVQFHQSVIEELEIHLAVDSSLYDKAAQDKISNALKYRFGENMKFIFKLCEQIPREASGKYALIKNKLA